MQRHEANTFFPALFRFFVQLPQFEAGIFSRITNVIAFKLFSFCDIFVVAHFFLRKKGGLVEEGRLCEKQAGGR